MAGPLYDAAPFSFDGLGSEAGQPNALELRLDAPLHLRVTLGGGDGEASVRRRPPLSSTRPHPLAARGRAAARACSRPRLRGLRGGGARAGGERPGAPPG